MPEENDGDPRYWESRWRWYYGEPDQQLRDTFASKDAWFEGRFHDLLSPEIRGDKVLDLGCGSSMYAPALLRRYNFYFGADVSESALKIGSKFFGYLGARFNQELIGDISKGAKLPYNDNFFDCVVTITVLQHQPGWRSMVDEIKRVLKKGGEYYGIECSQFWSTNQWVDYWKPVRLVHDAPISHPEWAADNLWYGR